MFRYRNVAEGRIISTIEYYVKNLEKRRLKHTETLSKTVLRVVGNAKACLNSFQNRG